MRLGEGFHLVEYPPLQPVKPVGSFGQLRLRQGRVDDGQVPGNLAHLQENAFQEAKLLKDTGSLLHEA